MVKAVVNGAAISRGLPIQLSVGDVSCRGANGSPTEGWTFSTTSARDIRVLGRRMADSDLVTDDGPFRFSGSCTAPKPVLLNLGEPGCVAITSSADRVQLIEASYTGEWDLPVLGVVSSSTTVLVRPDGYVAWVGDRAEVWGRRRAGHLVRAVACDVAPPAKIASCDGR